MTTPIGTGAQPVKPTAATAPAAAPTAAPTTAAPAAAPAPAPAAQPQVAVNWDQAAVNLDGVNVAAMPPAWPVGDKPIQGRTFSSIGDPHETTGDGLLFDNMLRGEFVKLMSATGDFVLQTRHSAWDRNPKATVNTAAAVAMGDDCVAFDFLTKKLTVNGSDVPFTPGSKYALPGGSSVEVDAQGVIRMTSPKGDKVNIELHSDYIDITGELAASRKDGEIRGSLGVFDNDTTVANDLLGRSGTTVVGNQKDQAAIDLFLNEWRVGPDENIFYRSEDMRFFNDYLDADGDRIADATASTDYIKERYDIDGDGKITRNELVAARAAYRAGLETYTGPTGNAAAQAAGGPVGGAGQPAPGAGWVATTKASQNMRKFDRNGDGKLTAAEYFRGTSGWDIGGFISRGNQVDEEALAREKAIRNRQTEQKAEARRLEQKQIEKK